VRRWSSPGSARWKKAKKAATSAPRRSKPNEGMATRMLAVFDQCLSQDRAGHNGTLAAPFF